MAPIISDDQNKGPHPDAQYEIPTLRQPLLHIRNAGPARRTGPAARLRRRFGEAANAVRSHLSQVSSNRIRPVPAESADLAVPSGSTVARNWPQVSHPNASSRNIQWLKVLSGRTTSGSASPDASATTDQTNLDSFLL